MDKMMNAIWTNPNHPASFSSIAKLKAASGKSKRETTNWLRNQLSYSLNKPVRKRFPTRTYQTSGINDLWQADLMEMIPYSKINGGNKYILTCIDVFSRFARALPLKSKSSVDVVEAVRKLFKNGKPRHFQTDQGTEFYNSKVKSVLDKLKINHYSVYSQYKAALVERFNRTLRGKLARYFVSQGNKKWVTVLPKIIDAYNNTVHRSIGLKPVDVSSENDADLWLKQNKPQTIKKPKYKVGDYVRMSRIATSPFIKNFNNNWSDEVFKIVKIDIKHKPVMYSIMDYENEIIQGKFYEQELQVIDNPTVYRIQKILRTKGKGVHKQYYVKWHGYEKPTWISESDLK